MSRRTEPWVPRVDEPKLPGLWCQWVPTDDGAELAWDGLETFYRAADRLRFLIGTFLRRGPAGRERPAGSPRRAGPRNLPRAAGSPVVSGEWNSFSWTGHARRSR
ncbi:hypothetical protein [Tomitella gaofuii]|uniref:hypothetical protein n=1 Tax=Tomitella gaofuii TaxID=2760083 RepID=UPI0015FBBF75|nr:hypothetical protein [Tomitella gaofuii]